MTGAPVVACHECDLLQREPPLPNGGVLRCRRCGAELYRRHPDGLSRALALTLTSIVLFVIGNVYPIVGLSVNGDLVTTTLLGAVRVLYDDGVWPLAGLVLATTFMMPLLQLAAMCYLLVPLWFRRLPYRPDIAFRLMHLAKPWGMTEVLILGMLVALVKLAHIASVVPGVALWSFGALMLLIVAASAAFDPRVLWQRMAGDPSLAEDGAEPGSGSARTAMGRGLLTCHSCGLLLKASEHSGHAS